MYGLLVFAPDTPSSDASTASVASERDTCALCAILKQEDAAAHMATVIDLLRHLGQHAAPNGDNALAGPVLLPGISDSPLTLPLAPALVAGWADITGRPTLGHHALALSAAQAGHSVALMGHGRAPHADLLLLSLSQLRFEHTTLWVIPDEAAELRGHLTSLADRLKLRWIDAAKPGARVTEAHLVVATPHDLHGRLLRFHDRAWRWLWPRLRIVALPELHHFSAVRGGHLRWLLRRVERLTDGALQILGSVAPVMDADSSLTRLVGRSVHVIAAPSGPAHGTLIALWRSKGDRGTAALKLARQLSARRLAVTVRGRSDAETERLRNALVAAEPGALSDDARVAIVAGVPRSTAERNALLRAGYRLVVLIVGDEPHELLLAHQPDLLLQALPRWPLAITNPYLAADHLACAAAELPLAEAEINAWQMREMRDRLLKKGVLLALPGSDLWHRAPSAEEPYAGLDPASLGGAHSTVNDPAGSLVGLIPPALLDRTALPGQVYTPRQRVASRDDIARTVQLGPDSVRRMTTVVADVVVDVREELAARTVRFGKLVADLVRGKALVKQQIRGLNEYRVEGSRYQPLHTAVEGQWIAAACWVGIKSAPADTTALGWSIGAVLPFVMLAPPAALIVSYDHERQRLYFVEAEPGGVGIADCVYDAFERLIELASHLTVACADSPLYRHVAALERGWFDALRGGGVSAPAVSTRADEREAAPLPVEMTDAAPARARPAAQTTTTYSTAPSAPARDPDPVPAPPVAVETPSPKRDSRPVEPTVAERADAPAPMLRERQSGAIAASPPAEAEPSPFETRERRPSVRAPQASDALVSPPHSERTQEHLEQPAAPAEREPEPDGAQAVTEQLMPQPTPAIPATSPPADMAPPAPAEADSQMQPAIVTTTMPAEQTLQPAREEPLSDE